MTVVDGWAPGEPAATTAGWPSPSSWSSRPRCDWVTNAGHRCRHEGTVPLGRLTVCNRHEGIAWDHVARVFASEPSEVARLAAARGLHRDENLPVLADLGRRWLSAFRSSQPARPSLIYYARRDQWVKIGTTTNLDKRMKSLAKGGSAAPAGLTIGPLDVLATHEGDARVEAALHDRFAAFRVAGEWFEYHGEVAEHIEHVRRSRAARR